MAVPTTYTGQTIDSTDIRMGKNAYVGAFDINMYYPAGKTWAKTAGVFCVVRSVTGLTLAPITEVQAMGIGKNVKEITQGEQWEGYSFEVYGNAKGIFRWLANTDPDSLSVAHDYQYPNKPLFLFEHVYDPEAGTMAASRLIPYGIARSGEFAGLEPDAETFSTLEFYNRDSTDYPVRTLKEGHIWVAEGWYEGGSVVNNDAPDGALLNFVLGTGNESYTNPTTPVAVVIDDAATGAAKYLYVFVNGVDVTSQVTYTPATKTIAFATAPALNARLVVIYAVDISAGAVPPLWDQGATPTEEEQTLFSWEDAGTLA
jgi:hypothetical protein